MGASVSTELAHQLQSEYEQHADTLSDAELSKLLAGRLRRNAGSTAIRESLLLGITLQGLEEFIAGHWDSVCNPDIIHNVKFPQNADELDQLICALTDSGHTNEWPGDCPVLRVLESAADELKAPSRSFEGAPDESKSVTTPRGDSPAEQSTEDLCNVVRRAMNGYNNQTAVKRACTEGCSWCDMQVQSGSHHVGKATVFVSWALG